MNPTKYRRPPRRPSFAPLLPAVLLSVAFLMGCGGQPSVDPHAGHAQEADTAAVDHSGMPGMDMPEMDMTGMTADGHQDIVRIDAGTIQKIGVRTSPVRVTALTRKVRTTGRFVMDEQAERTITLKVSGYVEHLEADFDGKKVNLGDHLFDLYSPEVLATQEELLAVVNIDERLAEAARQRLRLWDIPENTIRHVESSGEVVRAIPFHAPASGEIMRKQITEGAFVRAGDHLMDIVDISRTWLLVDVHEQDLPWIEVGTTATVELPYDPGTVLDGELDYIYHMLSEPLRAARARIVLRGGHHAPFKPGMFATVTLDGKPSESHPTVPSESVVQDGRHEMVVLALGEGRFRPVSVRTGMSSNGWTQVIEGLQGDEIVVTSAQFLIDSESRLGSVMGAMAGMDM